MTYATRRTWRYARKPGTSPSSTDLSIRSRERHAGQSQHFLLVGERALFVNPGFTDHIVGLSAPESRRVLELLYEQITRPEYTVRFRWQAGSIAFWDNRATSHLAPSDLDHLDVQRTLHRVTLIGDRPVGPDGFVSEIVAGREFRAESLVVA